MRPFALALFVAVVVAGCHNPRGPRARRDQARRDLKQVGLAFQNYCSAMNAPVQSIDDIAPYLNDQKVIAAFHDGTYLLCEGGHANNMPHGFSHTLLAYQARAEKDGIRIVVMADGSVQEMDEDEFAAAPCAGQP